MGRRRNVNGAVWVKEELVLGHIGTLAGFARYDRYLNQDAIGYGLDASLTFSQFLTLYAGGSRSRRNPNYPELYWTDSTVTRVDPVEAEKHLMLEGGIRGTIGRWAGYELTLFERKVDRPILLTPMEKQFVFPGYTILNGNQLKTRGVEATVRLRIGFVFAEGTGSWIEQTEEDNGMREVYPRFFGHAGIYYWDTLLEEKLELKTGFRGRYLSSSRGELFNAETLSYVISDAQPTGSGYSVDFFLTAHIGDAYVHVMWENLSGAEYFATPFFPALDRALRFGISWEFLN
jgi:outer membrane receptor protein involved in Fe transport